jgi:hypothetical protein
MQVITLQAYLKLQHKVNIEEFCSIWIPKLYGIHPGEYGYKKACILELVKLTENAITYESIRRHWKWEDGKQDYPIYINPLLSLAHQRYAVLEALGKLQ